MKTNEFLETIADAGFEVINNHSNLHIRNKVGHVNYLVAKVSKGHTGSIHTNSEGFERLPLGTKEFLVENIVNFSMTPLAERDSDEE